MPASEETTVLRKRNWAWVWLGYTGFLFIQPILEPSRELWLGTIAIFAIFLAIFPGYVRAIGNTRPTRYWMIAATFALGLVTFPWNQGASTFFVYAAAFLPFSIESTRRVLSLFLLECVVILAEGALFNYFSFPEPFHIPWPSTFIAIFLVIVIGGGNIFFAEQKRSNIKLHMAQEEIEALAAVAERERIGRDLHDLLGHTLSLITLKSELANRLFERDPHAARREIADVAQVARDALAQVRRAVTGIRAAGIAAELASARLLLESNNVRLAYDLADVSLPADVETVLAMTVREAVTNIQRHARATSARVSMRVEHKQLQLEIADDGRGGDIVPGNGLCGMRERLQRFGATLRIDAVHGQGTRLTVRVPQAGLVATAADAVVAH